MKEIGRVVSLCWASIVLASCNSPKVPIEDLKKGIDESLIQRLAGSWVANN